MKKSSGKLLVAILIILAVASILNIIYLLKAIYWPYNLDYAEGGIYLTKISYLYKSLNSYPYLLTYYTPLFYILNDVLRALIKSSVPYFYSRLASFIATIFTTIIMYMIAEKVSANRKIGLLSSLLFLSSALSLYFGITPSPIMFELLFDLIAIYLIISSKGRKYTAAAAVSLVIAFLFRQSALTVFLAIAIYLLLSKKKSDLLLFAAVFIIIFALVFVPINIVTNGRFLFSLFEIPLLTPLSVSTFLTALSDLFYATPLLILIPLSIYYLYKNPKSVLSITLVLLSIASLTAFKLGSSYTYFVPAFALACIISSLVFADLEKKATRLISLLLQILVMLFFIYGIVSITINLYVPKMTPASSSLIGISLRNVNGTILAENPDVDIFANKSIVFEPSVFWILQSKGLWNDSQIVDDISHHKFAAIVYPIGYGRFTYYPNIINATNEYYQLNYTEYGWDVYTPK